MLLMAHNPERFRRIEQTNLLDIDPDKLTPAQLDKIAEHLIKKALESVGANNPVTVADVTRSLEAGETVTVETSGTT